MDASERELAVNAQHMINMIRLRNHARHPSKTKQNGDAHLMEIENTFNATYTPSKYNKKTQKPRKGVCDYKKWETKYTQYWSNTTNTSLRKTDDIDNEEKTKASSIIQNTRDIKKVVTETIKNTHTRRRTIENRR